MDHQPNIPAAFEQLEPRRLFFTGAPLKVFEFDTPAGPGLDITGTAGRDRISVVATDAGLVVVNNKGGWGQVYPNHYALIRVNAARGDDRLIIDGTVTADTILYGSNGDDTITGGAGDDRIYGGQGRDRILAGAGDDTIVSIGDSVLDRTDGGEGFDSFWADDAATEIITDASADETARGAVHRIGAFFTASTVGETEGAPAPAIPRELGIADLPDPTASSGMTYVDFAGLPLFASAGPTPADVRQGSVGDCFFLAPLASLAQADPARIRLAVVDLGDGTFAVRFHDEEGGEAYVRVDGDLPVRASSPDTPACAKLGAERSLWVAIMEKAYAFFRRGDGLYASLNRGWMTEAFTALGASSQSLSGPANAADLLADIKAALDAGAAMTWATGSIPSGTPLVSNHAYVIEAVNLDAQGQPISVVLRNPWGTDGGGNNDGANDGYVTLTGQQLYAVFWAVVYADIAPSPLAA